MALFFVVPLALIAVISLRPDLRGGITTAVHSHPGAVPDALRQTRLSAALWHVAGDGLCGGRHRHASSPSRSPTSWLFAPGNRAGLYLALLLVPFWTSFLLRVMAWKVMLGSNGVINGFLISTGLTAEPLQFLLYNRFAVVITLIYVWTPFVALPILAGLQRIDPTLFEAAADLGSNAWQRFWRITLPLSKPGVMAGFFMCFIPTVWRIRHATAGRRQRRLDVRQPHPGLLHQGANWPLGAAMSLVMLLGTFALVASGPAAGQSAATRVMSAWLHRAATDASPAVRTLLGGYFALLSSCSTCPSPSWSSFRSTPIRCSPFRCRASPEWYAQALGTPTALTAARNSLIVAIGSSLATTVLATMVAILIARYEFRGKPVAARHLRPCP